jgi:hypothetical protein
MGLKYTIGEHVGKGMMVYTLWNGILKLEPFVVQWIVQIKKDTHMLRVVENHMSFWNVVGNEMCCWLMLRFQEERNIDQL